MSFKFFVFFMLLSPGYYAKIEENRIIGGFVPVRQTHAKYTVSIANRNKIDENDPRDFGMGHFCGGSIIGKSTILTAAHCVHNKRPNDLLVIAGTPIRTKKVSTTQCLHVKRVIVHEDFVFKIGAPDDIALLILKNKLVEDYKTVQHIPLASKRLANTGDKCLLVGWGQVDIDECVAEELRYVRLSVLDKKSCLKIANTICAGDPAGAVRKGSCFRDSGGPLFCNGRQTGLVTMGASSKKVVPTHFTDISKYLDWIRSNSADKIHGRSAAEKSVTESFILKICVYYWLLFYTCTYLFRRVIKKYHFA